MKILRNEKGQSATEYMLIIAVVVIGVVSAASHFLPRFKMAVDKLAGNVSGWVEKDQPMESGDGG